MSGVGERTDDGKNIFLRAVVGCRMKDHKYKEDIRQDNT
jgi:hypothetical protein